MRICIPIKQVPEPDKTKLDEETGRIIREGVRSVINPLDLYAIERGLQLKDAAGAEIVVVSMGPAAAVEAVREAVSMGCDGGYLVSDSGFAGSDTWATAYILSAAIWKTGPYDLILCGERAIDGETGQVGPGIAAFLDLPLITYAAGLEVGGGRIRVKRLTEERYEYYSCGLPAAVTVVKEIANPRLPTLDGKKRAKAVEVPVLGKADLELDDELIGTKGSPTRVKKIFRPDIRREGERVLVKKPADVPAAVRRIVEYLERNNILEAGE